MKCETVNFIKNTERQTGRTVTIEAEETEPSLSKCDLQAQSPLFALLPREIRDLIWAFATAPFEDVNHQYQENEYRYRPGYTAGWKSDPVLLRTCRRIWLEANAFPMLQAEHCFWPYRNTQHASHWNRMKNLTTFTRRNLGHVHFFAWMCASEHLTSTLGELRQFLTMRRLEDIDFLPRMLHITIRHIDWWLRGNGLLRIKDSWVQALLDSPDLRSTQTLELELETRDDKADQLLSIVERLEQLESEEFETHIVDGRKVRTKFVLYGEREVNKWTGPSKIDGEDYSPYERKENMNYHAITLTWKLRFSQLPYAHIPGLRLAPRITIAQSDITNKSKDPFKGKSSWFSRPVRRRNYKNITSKQWHLEMLNANLRVRVRAAWQAEIHEQFRNAMFAYALGGFHVKIWDAEKSLLRFVE